MPTKLVYRGFWKECFSLAGRITTSPSLHVKQTILGQLVSEQGLRKYQMGQRQQNDKNTYIFRNKSEYSSLKLSRQKTHARRLD